MAVLFLTLGSFRMTGTAMLHATGMLGMFPVLGMGLMELLGFLPLVTLAGNSGEEQTGGEEVSGFHARRI